MKLLTILIITKNELDNLQKLLPSLRRKWINVVILDSKSLDGSQEYCDQYENVTFREKMFVSFGDQWNSILNLEYPETEWVMKLDADERISEVDLELLRKFLMSRSNTANKGFEIKRRLNLPNIETTIYGWEKRIWRYGTVAFTDVLVNEHPYFLNKSDKWKKCHVLTLSHLDSISKEVWLKKQIDYALLENQRLKVEKGMDSILKRILRDVYLGPFLYILWLSFRFKVNIFRGSNREWLRYRIMVLKLRNFLK